jgi:hypothetical protein
LLATQENEGALLRLVEFRIGNANSNAFEFGASNYVQVDLDHDGEYIAPGKEQRLVARFKKSPVSAPLCEFIEKQPFFEGLKEMKDSGR